MPPGTIIILNGTSSAGKTSILTALQSILAEPYLHAGLDTFCKMLPLRYLWGPEWAEVLGPATQPHRWARRLSRACTRP
jgi:chloramphenicol 3-O phosphotransferase